MNKDDDTADEFFSIDKNDSKTVLPYVLRVSKSRYGINFPDISFDIRVYTRHQTGEVKRLRYYFIILFLLPFVPIRAEFC